MITSPQLGSRPLVAALVPTLAVPAAGRRSVGGGRRKALAILMAVALIPIVVALPADAGARPVVSALSRHHGIYWGGETLTVYGSNFTSVRSVLFGTRAAKHFVVVSPTRITAREPAVPVGTYNVRVVTATGRSTTSSADLFTYRYPNMDTPIYGHLSARQEQRISAGARAAHHNAPVAPRSRRWTAAMGSSAVRRARSWIGVPYSWAGGNGSGPTYGVCQHNGGDNDCHVIGFDCSGLTLYSWWPYEHLVHYAATQHDQAGRFHPTIAQLMPGDLVFFSSYIPEGIGHTAIYAGGGNVIQAEESGTLVKTSRLVDVIAHSGTYRGATRPTSTGAQGSAPRVWSSTPRVPTKGGLVTIRGRMLDATTTVMIGSKIIYHFVDRTADRLVVKAPPHAAGQVSLAVSNAWGTTRRPLGYEGAPAMYALTPAQGSTTSTTPVTITGRNFAPATGLTLDGRRIPFTVVDDQHARVTMPAHAAATVVLTMTSPFGTSNQEQFTYRAPVPATPTPTTAGAKPTTTRRSPEPISSPVGTSTTAPAGAPTTWPATSPATTPEPTPATTAPSATSPPTTPTTTSPSGTSTPTADPTAAPTAGSTTAAPG